MKATPCATATESTCEPIASNARIVTSNAINREGNSPKQLYFATKVTNSVPDVLSLNEDLPVIFTYNPERMFVMSGLRVYTETTETRPELVWNAAVGKSYNNIDEGKFIHAIDVLEAINLFTGETYKFETLVSSPYYRGLDAAECSPQSSEMSLQLNLKDFESIFV